MEWMILPLKRYFEFTGRSRRKEFWMFALFLFILGIVASIVDHILGYGAVTTTSGPGSFNFSYTSYGPLTIILLLGTIIPRIAVAIRRLHDTDRSGWWLLLILIPIIGWIILLVFYCTDGTHGPNRFGEDPKGPGEGVAEVFS